MGHHFRAFSFVDRIVHLESGRRANARYTIPVALSAFPISLVAESVGQVAAWVAMAATEFRRRPLAGLAGSVEMLSAVQPGHTLDLHVELDRLDHDAIAYGGTAGVNGTVILQLAECVGPMLPAEQFDDPAALRERFNVLIGSGASPAVFPGVDELALHVLAATSSLDRRATLRVPESAPFFADHFPRRPVLPGTLLLDALFRFACTVARDLEPRGHMTACAVRRVSGVKLRTFVAPGDTLDLEARLLELNPGRMCFRLSARVGERSVASARVELLAGVEG
jgi:3-hydroxymyristoyl/3-hydroxydecanoyl-(acyl carrier protein) dehydratase